MNSRSSQPFGRRGRSATPVLASEAAANLKARSRQTENLPPELVVTLLASEAGEAAVRAPGAGKVRRSFRAAILAGLIVASLNAAANAAFAAHATAGLNDFWLGSAQVPVAVALLIGALWAGGSSGAACLLVAHRLLARMGRTSYRDYVLGGGGAALALALITSALGSGQGPHSLAVAAVSGMMTGYFYRRFAGTLPPGPNMGG